jgi:hypothetical protein
LQKTTRLSKVRWVAQGAKTNGENEQRNPRATWNQDCGEAFFASADEIAEPQRAEVIKAALVLIPDELKAARGKVAGAKAKAIEKAGTGKPSANPIRRSADVAKNKSAGVAKSQNRPATIQTKVPAKRARKAAPKSAEPTRATDEPVETAQPNS